METHTQSCPLCKNNIPILSGHPKYICPQCLKDHPPFTEYNQPIECFISASQGLFIRVKGDTRPRNTRTCYVNGLLCWIDEYLTNVVIELMDREHWAYDADAHDNY